jgi:hypothetical protein
VPDLLERFGGTNIEAAISHDPVQRAYEKWQHVLENTELYTIDQQRSKAIDKVVQSAEKTLLD